jgi:hypothetical protein
MKDEKRVFMMNTETLSFKAVDSYSNRGYTKF